MDAQTPSIGVSSAKKEVLIGLFVRWYFVEHPIAILRTYGAYMKALLALFSFGFILKTLFSPWKGIIDVYPSKGFNLEAILSTFFLNITTRMIGAALRLATVLSGVCVLALVTVGYAVYILFWYAFPLLLVLSPVLLR